MSDKALKVKTHKDLEVWKKAIDFVTALYKQTVSFPKEEMYGLTNQMRRAAVSIPSNIAEGSGRKTKASLASFWDLLPASAKNWILNLFWRNGWIL